MPVSEVLLTVDNPIPTWKGPLENGVPAILTISADAPAISGSTETRIDYYCAETFMRDGGVIDYEKILSTIVDDQS